LARRQPPQRLLLVPAAISGYPVQKGFSAMNFRILAAPVWPRGRVFAVLAATALATSFVTSEVHAQAPAPAAPKARPKAPAHTAPAPSAQPAAPGGQPQAGAQPPQDQQIQLIYAPWTKFCLKGQGAEAKQVCFTGKDGRIESGQPVIAAVIIEPEGEPKKILRVTLPLGMQLVHGTRIIVDNNPPIQAPYVICFQNGCMSDYEATPELIANMKKGKNLVVQAINSNGQPLTLPLPLEETGGSFAKAYDGPPTDPKVFEENQKKLQEELQKRAEEARKKLEATQQPAAGAAPAK
jgi:invasion protein IalB